MFKNKIQKKKREVQVESTSIQPGLTFSSIQLYILIITGIKSIDGKLDGSRFNMLSRPVQSD